MDLGNAIAEEETQLKAVLAGMMRQKVSAFSMLTCAKLALSAYCSCKYT